MTITLIFHFSSFPLLPKEEFFFYSRASINLTAKIKFLILTGSQQQEDILGELFVRTRSLLFTGLASGLRPHTVTSSFTCLGPGNPTILGNGPHTGGGVTQILPCYWRPAAVGGQLHFSAEWEENPRLGIPLSSPTSASHSEKLSLDIFGGNYLMNRNAPECGLLLNTRKLTDLLLGRKEKKRWNRVDK